MTVWGKINGVALLKEVTGGGVGFEVSRDSNNFKLALSAFYLWIGPELVAAAPGPCLLAMMVMDSSPSRTTNPK